MNKKYCFLIITVFKTWQFKTWSSLTFKALIVFWKVSFWTSNSVFACSTSCDDVAFQFSRSFSSWSFQKLSCCFSSDRIRSIDNKKHFWTVGNNIQIILLSKSTKYSTLQFLMNIHKIFNMWSRTMIRASYKICFVM